ncbi:NAD(P)-dependent oxidoreductase [Patescibacteria group bacterium]|nr:MAG: NAD(P)-dependent oxidoreductase [Patescibacteria group bacterium]
MRLLILGAAGRTGRLLVDQALAAGYTVTGFARSKDETGVEIPGIATIVGDARNLDDLTNALKGQDAVISTLGSSRPGDRVIAASISSLIAAARAQGVKRVIIMSSFLVADNFQPNPIIKLALKVMGSIVADFKSGEQLLMQSDLDYTIVYATRLTNDPLNSQYRIINPDDSVGAGDSISRANVAEFLLKQLSDKTYIRKTVLITGK